MPKVKSLGLAEHHANKTIECERQNESKLYIQECSNCDPYDTYNEHSNSSFLRGKCGVHCTCRNSSNKTWRIRLMCDFEVAECVEWFMAITSNSLLLLSVVCGKKLVCRIAEHLSRWACCRSSMQLADERIIFFRAVQRNRCSLRAADLPTLSIAANELVYAISSPPCTRPPSGLVPVGG